MRTLLLTVTTLLFIGAVWWWACSESNDLDPTLSVDRGADEGLVPSNVEHGTEAGLASMPGEPSDEPTAGAAAPEAVQSGVVEEPQSSAEVASERSASPRRIRVVSELDYEPIPEAIVRVLGTGDGTGAEYTTDDEGMVDPPITNTLRCRFMADGYVPLNVGSIGVLPGNPISIVLRPYARLHGSVSSRLPLSSLSEQERRFSGHADPDPGGGGRIELSVDERRPHEADDPSNFRGILDSVRKLPETQRRVAQDRTWSLDVTIPPEIEALRGLIVWQVRGGTRRVIGYVPVIRLGDVVEVEDVWSDVYPLNLKFRTADGSPLSQDLLWQFYRSLPEGPEESIDRVQLDEEGRLQGVHLQAGEWQYRSVTELGSPDFIIEGSIQHVGAEEQGVQLPPGASLTVALLGKRRGGPSFRVGIALAGELPRNARYVRVGEEVIFPFVPATGAWHVVVRRPEAIPRQSLRATIRSHRLVEVHRVPVATDQGRIELKVD